MAMAMDGEEGLRKLEEDPDLVLLDVDMLRLDGFGVLKWMWAGAPLPGSACDCDDGPRPERTRDVAGPEAGSQCLCSEAVRFSGALGTGGDPA